MIYWFYGQPGSGKTTLAKSLLEKIDAIHVDGDDVRKIFNNQDYSKEGRIKNLTNINNIVRFLNHKGFNVVVSVVSPYKEIRDQLLDLGVKYYYVRTSEIRGKENFFVEDFQIGDNDIILDTTNKSANEILAIYW
jgi:adenylylsulfate kinase